MVTVENHQANQDASAGDPQEVFLRQAVEQRPADPTAWERLVQHLLAAKQWDQAQQIAMAGLRHHPRRLVLQRTAFFLAPAWIAPQEGATVRLRTHEAADAAYLASCFSNQAFMRQFHRFAPRGRTESELRRLTSDARESLVRHRAVHWLIEKRQDDGWRPAGLAALVDVSPDHLRAELLVGCPRPEDRGHTVPLSATLLAMGFAFNAVSLNKLTSVVYADNPVAQANTLACGFRQEGRRQAHLRDPDSGQWLDTFENGLVEADFRSNTRLARLSKRLLKRDITMLHKADR